MHIPTVGAGLLRDDGRARGRTDMTKLMVPFCSSANAPKNFKRAQHGRYVPRLKVLKSKGKAVPVQTWSGPEGSRKLRFPDFMTTAHDGDKVVSLTHRPPLPPGNTPGTHFC